ncbi:hypothetical protein pipiens_000894, partial [Culex pipiens pipiens]
RKRIITLLSIGDTIEDGQ